MARLTARPDRLLVRTVRVVRTAFCALFLLLCVLRATAPAPASATPRASGPAGAAPTAEAEKPDDDLDPTPTGGRTAPEDVPGERVWPVGPPRGGGPAPPVVHGWDPPPTPYAAGHRGVDLAAEPGSTVRAAMAGTVRFVGGVAGRRVLSIELDDSGSPPLRITYEPVHADVQRGERVSAGRPVGVLDAGPFHCAEGCLHWGLRRDEAYLDPLALLPPDLGRRPPSRLLPVFGVPEAQETPGLAALRGGSPPLREWLLISLLTGGGCWARRRLRPRRTLRPSGPGRPSARVLTVAFAAAFNRRHRAGPSRRRPP